MTDRQTDIRVHFIRRVHIQKIEIEGSERTEREEKDILKEKGKKRILLN